MAKTTFSPLPPANRLRALVAPKGLAINANSDRPTIYIYDEIGDSIWYPAIGAKDIVAALDEIGQVPEIDVRINSPGGDVFEGEAIYSALNRNRAKIFIHIDGLAASAASFIAMAGDSIEMAENGFLMLHEAWTFAMGNKIDLAKVIDLLSKIDSNLAQIYSKRSGSTLEAASKWMAEETWFTAQEALDSKLIDKISQPLKTPAETAAKALAKYAKPPKALKELAESVTDEKRISPTPRLDAIKKRLAA